MPRRPPRNPWTDEQDRELKRLQSEGLSATEIANDMQVIRPGTSRNSVIGRLTREGLPVLGGSLATTRAAIEKREGKRDATVARSERMIGIRTRTVAPQRKPLSQIPDVQSNPVSLFEAKLRQCRWPLNDKEPIDAFRFCGGKTVVGSSWCGAHRRMAYA